MRSRKPQRGWRLTFMEPAPPGTSLSSRASCGGAMSEVGRDDRAFSTTQDVESSEEQSPVADNQVLEDTSDSALVDHPGTDAHAGPEPVDDAGVTRGMYIASTWAW